MKTHFLPTLPHGLGLGGGKGLPFFVSPLDHHRQPWHHVLAHHPSWHQSPWASSLV